MTRKTPLLLPLALLLALSACKPAQEPTPRQQPATGTGTDPGHPAAVEEILAERATTEFPTLKMKAVDGSDHDLPRIAASGWW